MLWYKAWLDTRWRFVTGFVLLVCGAWLAVFGYPQVSHLLQSAPAVDTTTPLGRQVQELVQVSRGFRGYVWSQWYRQSGVELGTLFAVLLGSGGLAAHAGRGELYTLSLPARRSDLLIARATMGLVQLFLLTFVPSIVIAAAAPAIGQQFGIASAFAHATCLFTAGASFFSLALLLSTSYGDVWRPMLIAGAAAVAIALSEIGYPPSIRFRLLRLMSGDVYFRTGQVPWVALAAAATLSAALIAIATVNLNRRDF